MADNAKLGRLHDTVIEKATGDRAPEPVIHVTAIKGDGEDEAKAGRKVLKDIMDEAAEKVEETTREWGSAPRPNPKDLSRRLSEIQQEAHRRIEEIGGSTYNHLDRLWADTYAEIDWYRESQDPQAEAEYRRYARELDPDERISTVRRLVEENETARRAFLNPSFAPEIAGLPSEDYREELREQVVRQKYPEEAETVEALQMGMNRWQEDVETAEEFVRRVTNIPPEPTR